jgi:hypothetical protein
MRFFQQAKRFFKRLLGLVIGLLLLIGLWLMADGGWVVAAFADSLGEDRLG